MVILMNFGAKKPQIAFHTKYIIADYVRQP